MDIKDLKALYKFIKDTDITEIELDDFDGKGKVKLKRGQGAQPVAVQALQRAATPPAAPREEKPVVEAVSVKPDNIKIVTSPMVGTFYRAASPEAQAFVEIGSVVKSGAPLCIIEAMKLMNEVEAELGGKIVSILVENGQPVEYGEPLFHIET
ncbi:MAG: acetyl-CoA carboxylase biotin carboxyl carrier protein [Deltaproteobacteria bacterium]|nr:acetyl-CoA carboxylase biotin carboxyl carrier protein [Deltaproteobacteria bacterium]